MPSLSSGSGGGGVGGTPPPVTSGLVAGHPDNPDAWMAVEIDGATGALVLISKLSSRTRPFTSVINIPNARTVPPLGNDVP